MDKKNQIPDIYLHLGLPKTATTLLQTTVFPKLRDICYIPKHHFWRHRRYVDKKEYSKYLLSSEHDWNMESVLKDFSQIYPHAKVIIAFRRHDKWLQSKYRYYIRKSGHLNFESFFDIDHDDGLWKVNDLYFMDYIKMIEKYFPAKPLVIFQDDLRNDFYGVIDQLSEYMGVTYSPNDIRPKIIKKAFNDKQLFYLRKFNQAFKHNPEKYKGRKKLKKVHIYSRKYVVHTYAFLSNIIPKSFTHRHTLIPKDKLNKIRSFYSQDWEECRAYAKAYQK
jgi:hypothetical protein